MKLAVYKPEHKKEWDDFIQQSKNGLFMFKRDYMDYHSDRFEDHSLLFYDDKKLIAVLPASTKDNILYSHQGLTFGGVVSDYSMKTQTMLDLFASLKRYLRENNFSKCVYKAIPYIYHKIPAQEDLYALSVNKAILSRVDVTTTIDLTQNIRMSSLRKRGSKKAKKSDVLISVSDDFEGFMSLLETVLMDRHETQPVHSLDEIVRLKKSFPMNVKLYEASNEHHRFLAGVVVFEYENLIHAQYIAASEKGRELGALDLLFVELIENVYQSKRYFDFGISTEKMGLFLNQGLVSQKEGFGGRAIVHQFYELYA